MRCGIVLFVRNEVQSIASWIAWHIIKGFSDIIVYDDYSTDGTWEKLNALEAQAQWRLHLFRSEKSEINFEIRQGRAYEEALSIFADLDWLAFLDADEFLQLDSKIRIDQFLLAFPAAEAVAVNWCMYGSSGFVERPRGVNPELYLRHSEQHWMPNRHVKSIVRPRAVRGGYFNQHYFRVSHDGYVNTLGEQIVWSDQLGIVANQAIWSRAKIMHYQCRSMEDFVRRAALRSDVAYTPADFYALDRNEVEDLAPLNESVELHQTLRYLQKDGARNALAEDLISRIDNALSSDSHASSGVYLIKSPWNVDVCTSHHNELTQGCLGGSRPVILIVDDLSSEVGFLVPEYPSVERSLTEGSIIKVFLTWLSSRSVALQSIINGSYLRAIPDAVDLSFDATEIREWEKFRVSPFGGRVNKPR